MNVALVKRYLLTAGDQYYPSQGSEDWIGFFSTIDEAEKKAKKIRRDWYEIIDIQEWIDNNE